MTAPAGLLDPGIVATVYVDGARVADTGAELAAGTPTVLSGVAVQWGRSTTVDQPGPSTCSFTVADAPGARSFLDLLTVGHRVDLYASGYLYGDQAGAEVLADPGFEAVPVGSRPVCATADGTTAAAVTIAADASIVAFGDSITAGTWLPYPDSWIPKLSARLGVPIDNRAVGGAALHSPGDVDPNVVMAQVTAALAEGKAWTHAIVAAGTNDLMTHDTTTIGQSIAAAQAVQAALAARGISVIWVGVLPMGYGSAHADGDVPVLLSRRVPLNQGLRALAPSWYDTDALFGADSSGFVVDSAAWLLDGLHPNAVGASQMADSFPLTGTGPVHGGARSIEIRSADPLWVRPTGITIPPAPFAPPGQDRSAWDHVPATSAGSPWHLSAWVKAPAGSTVTLIPTVYSAPWASVGQSGAGRVEIVADGAWQQVKTTYWATAAGRWVGLSVTVTNLPRWVDFPPDQAWADTPGTWLDYGRWFLDDCSISTSEALLARSVLVFTGRITDVEARWQDRRLSVDVTAADPLAELANTVIGDQPWPEETLGGRVSKILTLAGGAYPAVVDDPAGSRLVTYRDVDAQASAGLLAELAASADAVAWVATHATAAGPYVWVEDVSGRGALYVLAMNDQTGLVEIVPTDQAAVFTELSACRVLRDPVRWIQQVADVSTVVDVVWREQTLDEHGQQRPTDRHVTVTDAELRARYGTRRVGLSTQLSREGDAVEIADQLFARLTVSEWRVSGLAWDTAVGEDFTDDDMTLALDLLDGQRRLGHPLMVVDLPEWSPVPAGRAPVYVEGGTYTFDGGRWVLDFHVSSATSTGGAVAWNDLDPSWAWQDLDPSISWVDLNGVSVQ